MGKAFRILSCAVVLAVWSGAARADECAQEARARGAVTASDDETASHRIAHDPVYRTGKLKWAFLNAVSACVLVDANGEVQAILAVSAVDWINPLVAHDAAQSFLHTRYKPFLRDGKPVPAVVRDSVEVLPLERRPKTARPMPKLRDPSTLSITLSRGPCMGDCPIYTVELRGDGSVRFHGDGSVMMPGDHRANVSPDAVRALFERFRAAEFFRLYDSYWTPVTDSAAYELTLRFDGHRKKVTDYVGESAGMPPAVTELENAVDSVAGTKRWTEFGPDTVETMKREHYDVRAHPDLLSERARVGDTDGVRALIAMGAATDDQRACSALGFAAMMGYSETVNLLLDAGVPLFFADGGPGCNPLAEAAYHGYPGIARAILARHPPKSALDEALLQTAYGYGPDVVSGVNLLVASGADLEARDSKGRTPLMRVRYYPAILRALLAAGAKIDARDTEGNNALADCSDDESAHILLEAGADPWARDKNGKAIVDKARPLCAAAIKDWMAAHPRAP